MCINNINLIYIFFVIYFRTIVYYSIIVYSYYRINGIHIHIHLYVYHEYIYIYIYIYIYYYPNYIPLLTHIHLFICN